MELLVALQGTIRCFDDETLPLAEPGRLTIQRGSHVEPTTGWEWTADFSLVGGPLLRPFPIRTDAVRADVDRLRTQWLVPSPIPSQDSNS